MQNTIVSKKFGLVRHPHWMSGDMVENGFCLICQHVHAFIIDEPLNPSIGPTCRVTDEGEHGMATISPPFMSPKKAVDTTPESV